MHASRTSSAERWLAVGQSGDPEARAAGRAAAASALTGEDPKLLVVFCCESYDLAELVAGIREAAGETPMIGCSTAGEISTAGPGNAGVVVTALGGPGFEVATASADAADGRLREALDVAERVSAAVSEPMVLGGRESIITASIGIAHAEPGTRAEDMLRDSDVAMYGAKERGRSHIELFDAEMRRRMMDRLEMEGSLRAAIAAGDLRLDYQPIVSFDDWRVTAAEALVRWDHPERGAGPPGGVHPPGRGQRPHPPPRPVGADRGLPAGWPSGGPAAVPTCW